MNAQEALARFEELQARGSTNTPTEARHWREVAEALAASLKASQQAYSNASWDAYSDRQGGA